MPRPKKKSPPVRLSVSLDAAVHAELAKLAEEHDVSIAWMVRKAISEFVQHQPERRPVALSTGQGSRD